MKDNFWDELMGNDEDAGMYMHSYGEGVGSETRHTVGSFINNGETVLDVGCGPGWNYEHFQKFGPLVLQYKGVDYSQRFVRACSQKYPGVEFELQDCRDLKERDESWDVLILQDVLEHTNGYKKPMEEALRVARERVIVVFWKPFRDDSDTDEPNDQINDDGNDGYGSNYERGAWERYLDSLGYHWMETESTEKANRPHVFYIIDKKEKHG